MPQESLPAFQFYVKEWRSSRAVMRMSFAERGMYLEMLLEQWENLSLPDDPTAVAELIGGAPREWSRAWDVLRRKFITLPDGRIQNIRLERCRVETKKFMDGASRGGLNRAKNAKRGPGGTYIPASAGPADNQPPGPADTSQAPAAWTSRHQAPSSTSSSSSSSSSNGAHAPAGLAAEYPADVVLDAFGKYWKRLYGHAPSIILSSLQALDLEKQLAAVPLEQLVAASEAYLASTEKYIREAKHPLSLFLKDPVKYLATEAAPARQAPRGCRHEPRCGDDAAHTSRDMAERRQAS